MDFWIVKDNLDSETNKWLNIPKYPPFWYETYQKTSIIKSLEGLIEFQISSFYVSEMEYHNNHHFNMMPNNILLKPKPCHF